MMTASYNNLSTTSCVSVSPSSHTVTGSESTDHSSYNTNDDIPIQERRQLPGSLTAISSIIVEALLLPWPGGLPITLIIGAMHKM